MEFIKLKIAHAVAGLKKEEARLIGDGLEKNNVLSLDGAFLLDDRVS